MRGEEMVFDYTALRRIIKEQYGTFGEFAIEMHIPYQRLSRMLTGKTDWRTSEAYDAAKKLGILDEIGKYFFEVREERK